MKPRSVHYVIGDIHGRLDLMIRLIAKVCRYHLDNHTDRIPNLVFVGDYVDRGPDSAGVLERIRRGFRGFKMTCLKGNHEAMMLTCMATDDRDAWMLWISNGGVDTLKSFGYDKKEGRNPEAVRACVGDETIFWLKALPLYHQVEDIVFVHAGILPGVSLNTQSERDLLWIRKPFLNSDIDFGYGVVHGHTPVTKPDVRQNRINIDTGAVFDGSLTALVVDRPWAELREDPVFLQVK
ncbi:MAG: metallophosphoesterase family protein [Pseudomonadota bacterium]